VTDANVIINVTGTNNNVSVSGNGVVIGVSTRNGQ
jgi:hypothetical protein